MNSWLTPHRRQQVQFSRALRAGNSFVAFIDAIGELDGTPCVLEWKTTSARYIEEPAGIAVLDPQLICYSWMTGIENVAQVVFVRKRLVEVQYLTARITDEQRAEFETLVEDTVGANYDSRFFSATTGAASSAAAWNNCRFTTERS